MHFLFHYFIRIDSQYIKFNFSAKKNRKKPPTKLTWGGGYFKSEDRR